MKLVVAIVNNDDSHAVLSEITRAEFSATKLSTSGGFLRAGNGVEDERVSELIDLIGRFSRKRTQLVQPASTYINEPLMSAPVEITVGGATVFVLDVAQFYKL